MGKKSRRSRRNRELKRQREAAAAGATWWSRPAVRRSVLGLGPGVVAYVLQERFQLAHEYFPAAFTIGLALSAGRVASTEPTKSWLSKQSRPRRVAIRVGASVVVLGLGLVVWGLNGRSLQGVQVAGYPKFKVSQVLMAAANSATCPECLDDDEIDLDGIANLSVQEAARDHVVIAVSDVPTVELNNAKAGTVDLPGNSPSRAPTSGNIPAAGPPGTVALRVGGTATTGPDGPQITTDTITLQDNFRGNLKIRSVTETHRFDIGDLRPWLFTVGGRSFIIRLTRMKEDSPLRPPAGRTIHSYTFHVVEQ